MIIHLQSPKSWLTLTLIVLANLSHGVFSAPFLIRQQQPSCTPTCYKSGESTSTNQLNYEHGKSYLYDFESSTETALEKTTDETSQLQIKGQALLIPASSCDFMLTVQNVQIQSLQREKVVHTSSQLEGSSVRFAYQNGKIDGFCTSETDPTWSINIKRSIVSLLQNTATASFGDTTVMEVDISGRCPTEYTISDDKFRKTRNLTSCSYRNGGEWVSKGVPYSVTSEINSDPILKSTLTCDQVISEGVIKSVECTEQHQLEPMVQSSESSSTIQTTIKSTLTLVTIENANTKSLSSKMDLLSSPSSILFDHSDSDSELATKNTGASNTFSVVEQLCEEMKGGIVSSNVPSIYLALAQAMKSASEDELESIWSNIETGKICSKTQENIERKLRKLFLDAAARTGTTETIQFIVNRIIDGKVDGIIQKIFSHHTSFASVPRAETLTAMSQLISSRKTFEPHFILASTALAYEYCKETNGDCVKNSDYNTLVSHIASLADCSSQNENSIRETLVAIQALGNLNHLPASAANVLQSCIDSKDTPNRVRFQALGAFRRDPCISALKSKAMDLFGDKSESSEIRIHGYLASTRCMVESDVEILQEILKIEESNQVGSFVLSHIKNQLSSESPLSRPIKRLFSQLTIPKSYPFDPRRFSTNFAFSKFDSTENMGIETDANLIYSQDHFIPRTATGNLTGYFFGRGYNLVEFGVHLENFEHLFEQYFGPSAGLKSRSSTPPQPISNNAISKDSTSSEKSSLDQNHIDAIHSEVTNSQKIKNKFGKTGTIDFYVRELGTSIYSTSFSQNELLALSKFSLKNLFSSIYERFMSGSVHSAVKDFKIDLTDLTTFIDEEISFSTISGLPLKLTLQGNTILSLKHDGNIDIPAIIRNSPNYENLNNIITDIKSKILPSAATLVKASMKVGSPSFIESGLSLEATVHSSAGIDFELMRQEGKFEFKFNIPQQKVQLIDLKSQLFWTQAVDNGIEEKVELNSKWNTKADTTVGGKCVNTFSSVFGFKFCADIKIAGQSASKAPSFPFAGTSLVSLSIEKTEPSMEGYYFKAESILQSSTDQSFSIIFDTPGSITSRKITANGLIYQSDVSMKFGMDLVTPLRKARIDYQLWNEELLKGVELRVGSGESIYSGHAQLKQLNLGPNEVLYEPLITYSVPGSTVSLLEGQVKTVRNGIEVDLSATGQSKALQGKINGLIQLEQYDSLNRQFSLTGIQLENGALGKIHFGGLVTLNQSVTAVNVKTLYGPNLELNTDIALLAEFTNESDVLTRKMEAQLRSSHNDNLNVDLLLKRAISSNAIDTVLSFTHGAQEQTKSAITQESKIFWKSSLDYKIKNILEISVPTRGIDFSLSTDSLNSKKQQYHDFNLEAGSHVKANMKYDATGDDYDFTGLVSYPGQTFKLAENAKKTTPDKWIYKTSFESEKLRQTPFTIDADTEFVYKVDKSDMNTEILSKISSSAFADPFTFNSKFSGRPDAYLASLKLAKPDHDWLNFETEYTEALGNKPTTFSTKAFVINYFDGELSETHDRSSSIFRFESNWLPTGRKIIASSDLKKLQQGELYNFDGKLAWDAEKDKSKSASIKSVTLYQGRNGMLFDSKNTFIVEALTRELNLKGKLGADYSNAVNTAELQFKTAEGQLYAFELKSINENKTKVKSQNLQVKIITPEREPFEIDWKNRASNMDLKNLLAEFTSALNIKLNSTKNIKLEAELHSVLTNKWSINGLLEASGSALTDEMKLHWNTELQTGKVKYGILSNIRGEASELSIDVDFDVWSVKKTVDYKYKMKNPYTSIRTLEGAGKYGYLFTSWTNFDMYESGHVIINDHAPSSWDYGASFLQNDFKARYNMIAEGASLLAFTLNGKSTAKKISGTFKNKLRGGSDTELIFEVERPIDIHALTPSLNLKLNINPQDGGIDEAKNYRFSLRSLNHGQKYEISFRGRTSSNRVALANTIEFTQLRKSFDLVLTTDKSPARKAFFFLSGPIADRYNVEALVKWGDEGKSFASTGSFLKTGPKVEGILTVDSPHLNANKWKVRVAKELARTGVHELSLVAQSAEKDVGKLLIDYSKVQHKQDGSTHYNGSVSVKAHTLDFVGVFTTIDETISNRGGRGIPEENGRSVKTTISLSRDNFPVQFDLIGKRTNLEDRYSVSFCNVDKNQNCKTTKFLRQKFNSPTKKGQIITLSTTSAISGQQEATDSFIISTIREGSLKSRAADTPYSFEHFVRYVTSDGAILGYAVFRRNDENVTDGFEIDLLGQRKIGAVLLKKLSADSTELIFEGWLDKSRKPENKLSVIYTNMALSDDARSMETNTFVNANEMNLIVRHPTLPKDLLIKTKTEFKRDNELFTRSVEVLFDIFKPNHELLISSKTARNMSNENDHLGYEMDFGIKSEGQGIKLDLHSEILKIGEELKTISKFTYLNHDLKERVYDLDMDFGFNRRNFQLSGPTGRIFSYLSSYNYQLIPGSNSFNGYEVRREIYLPGMADTRIFQNKISFAFPPKVNIKMFTVSSPPGQYQQFQFGFKNDQEFIASLHEFESAGVEKRLLDFDIALNNSRLLFVKTEWNKENIKKFLTKGQVRIHDTASRFKSMTKDSSEYVAAELEHIGTTMKNSLPDFTPYVESFKKELIDLKVEVESEENFENLSHYFEFLLNVLGTDTKTFKQFLRSLSETTTEMFKSFLNWATSLPERIFATLQSIPKFFKKVGKGVGLALDGIAQTFSLLNTKIIESVDRISSSSAITSSSDYLTSLADSSQNVRKLWNETLIRSAEIISSALTKLKSSTSPILDSEIVQKYREQLIAQYEQLIAGVIENYKNSFDSIRKSALDFIADDEQLQEFLQTFMKYIELTKAEEPDSVRIQELQTELYEKFVKVMNGFTAKMFTIDLRQGVFIAHIPLPTPVKSLTDFDSLFESLPSYSKLSKIKLPSHNYLNFQNSFTYKNLMGLSDGSTSLDELIPPFKGAGLILGSQYFRTFDGKFYQFEGECSYLLASDFVDKNFSVIVDYKKDKSNELQKSIILTDHKNTISIEPDLKVLVNGKPEKIPATIGLISITKNQNWLKLTGARGYELACSTNKDICSFTINGFYQGKTNGLFGTFNSEQSDDLKTINDDTAQSTELVTSSWKINKQCKDSPVSEPPALRNSEAIQKCREAFKSRSSPLSSCFETIDSSNYENICNSLANLKGYDSFKSVCTAAIGYQVICRNSNILLDHTKLNCQYLNYSEFD